MSAYSLLAGEASEQFSCFGGECVVLVEGFGPAGTATQAAAAAKRRLLAWHQQFSRFEPGSELATLNRDSRATVPVSPLMARFVEAALGASGLTNGLVDPTLVGELEAAGYAGHFASAPLPLADALKLTVERTPARPSELARWREIRVNRHAQTVTRPPGVRLDSGGIAKGLFADVLGSLLCGHDSFAVNAAGDARFGGIARASRAVQVASPFDDSVLHVFELDRGGVATTGVGRRSWLDGDGLPAHHLLDPGTGRPALTGVVQATALAPTAVEAEALAKAALLSGPHHAAGWLRHGGLVVYDSGKFDVIDPAGVRG